MIKQLFMWSNILRNWIKVKPSKNMTKKWQMSSDRDLQTDRTGQKICLLRAVNRKDENHNFSRYDVSCLIYKLGSIKICTQPPNISWKKVIKTHTANCVRVELNFSLWLARPVSNMIDCHSGLCNLSWFEVHWANNLNVACGFVANEKEPNHNTFCRFW